MSVFLPALVFRALQGRLSIFPSNIEHATAVLKAVSWRFRLLRISGPPSSDWRQPRQT
jgi:hypothetical protein